MRLKNQVQPTQCSPNLHLKSAPIIEAVFDIDAELPPAFTLEGVIGAAETAFADRYPGKQKQLISEQKISVRPGESPSISAKNILQALQLLAPDKKQLVQVRRNGFSLNRLAPYSSFDDYLPEVQRCWEVYRRLCSPVLVRKVGLRYINRILLPIEGGNLNLEDYLAVCPHLPDEDALSFTSFLNRHQVTEPATGLCANITLSSQKSESAGLWILLDIEAFDATRIEVGEERLWEAFHSLRRLKNSIFERILTPKCLSLFQR